MNIALTQDSCRIPKSKAPSTTGTAACYTLVVMSGEKRSNPALWVGLLITVLGFLSNFLYFAGLPQAIIPWINLFIPPLGVIVLLVGLKRAFSQPQTYSGKIWGSFVAGFSLLLFAAAIFFFIHAREVPRSAHAPQVGQRAPDFTLPDSNSQPISLTQLFAATGNAPQPKSVLLIFYRGYW